MPEPTTGPEEDYSDLSRFVSAPDGRVFRIIVTGAAGGSRPVFLAAAADAPRAAGLLAALGNHVLRHLSGPGRRQRFPVVEVLLQRPGGGLQSAHEVEAADRADAARIVADLTAAIGAGRFVPRPDETDDPDH